MPRQSYGLTVAERLANPVSQFGTALRSFGRQMRVALPCIVKSFDASTQTVTVYPAIHEEERIDGELQFTQLPELQDVPVCFPRAGDFVLTFPVTAGDECLVIFADTCIDSWWQSGNRQNEAKKRRHALADGIAVFGPWSQLRKLDNYSTDSAQLRTISGSTVIDIADTQITVNASTVNINATTASVQASSQASVQAPTVNVAGSTAVNISGGHCVVDGKNFLQHTHTGVQAGGAVTGPVA